MPATLIRNTTVLTMDPRSGCVRNCDVLVDGARIVDVRPGIDAVDAQIVDASDMIVMPGFVDTHRHTWQSLLRNTAVDWSLGQYFAGVRVVMGDLYGPEDAYIANYIGALECLDAGITTLYDWSHNNNSPDHSDAAVSGLRDAGIRGIFGYGNANREWLPISELPTDFADVRRIQGECFAAKDGLLTMGFAARGPQYSTLNVSEADFRQARELGLPITVHVGSGHWGFNRPVDQLRSRGLLFPDTVYVHCCTIADDELQMIADSGGHVSVSPEVELNMGQGWPATLRAISVGLRPTISIDVTTSVGGDMFSAMRAMMAAARSQVNAKALQEQRILDKPALSSGEVLEFATVAGARACGLNNRVGMISPGMEADLILVDTNRVGMMPMNNAVGTIVECASVGHVDSVMVAGRFVKRGGCLLNVDTRALRARVERARDGLFARAKVPTDGTWLPVPYLGGTAAEIASPT